MRAMASRMHDVCLIPAGDGGVWDLALQDLPFASGHRHDYALATARALGDAQAALWTWRGREGRAACAVLQRPVDDAFDLTTPLGFAGMAVEGDVTGLGEAWTSDWTRRGAVAAYVQLSLQADEVAWLQADSVLSTQLHAAQACWCLDLAPEPGALLSGMAAKHRQLLRKWMREELTVERDTQEVLSAFTGHYAAFLETTPVAAAYRFEAQDLRRLAGMPGSLLVGVRGTSGAIEASMLFLSAGTRGESALSACSPSGRRHSRGLYWHGALALRERGVRWFNLGGGIRGDDGLSEFKQRLGARRTPTLALKQVFDEAAFARACARAARPASREGYFPPWRQPG